MVGCGERRGGRGGAPIGDGDGQGSSFGAIEGVDVDREGHTVGRGGEQVDSLVLAAWQGDGLAGAGDDVRQAAFDGGVQERYSVVGICVGASLHGVVARWVQRQAGFAEQERVAVNLGRDIRRQRLGRQNCAVAVEAAGLAGRLRRNAECVVRFSQVHRNQGRFGRGDIDELLGHVAAG